MDYLSGYEAWLTNEKKAASNTLSSYVRDVRQFSEWLSEEGIELAQAAQTDIKRHGHPRGYEKPHGGRYVGNA